MKVLDDALIDKLVGKEYEMLGMKYTREKCKMKDWYTQHTWSAKQQEAWKQWMITTLRDMKWTKRDATKAADYLVLMYGWRCV
jgi:hypothetical protein